MSCCSCTPSSGIEKYFSDSAGRYERRSRKRGLLREQKLLLEGIQHASVEGKTILDIGCGVGYLHHQLLKNGAARAYGIDISEEMIGSARKLAKESGLEGVTEYRQGDFTAMSESVEAADIVILDRVLCCYENVDALLGQALGKCRGTLAISFPRPALVASLSFHTMIVLGKVLRWSFIPSWHDWKRLLHSIRESGFTPFSSGKTFVWAVHVFRRE